MFMSVRFLWLSVMFWGFIHVAACISSLLLSIPLNAYITVFLFVFFTDGHLCCFQAAMNKATLSLLTQVFLWT